jgi:hypothetical protein
MQKVSLHRSLPAAVKKLRSLRRKAATEGRYSMWEFRPYLPGNFGPEVPEERIAAVN